MINPENPFGLKPNDLVATFIDGVNLYATAKHLDPEHNVNYNKLLQLFDDNCRLSGMSYYTTLRESTEEDKHNPIIPLIDYISNNGYRVYVNQVQKVVTELGVKEKASVNLDIALDAYDAALSGMTRIFLFASDGEMTKLVAPLQRRGCRVTVVSTKKDKVVSDTLRRSADEFVDLADIMHLIIRDTKRGPRRDGRLSI